MDDRLNIRPTVGVLGLLRSVRYTWWHALAEFVDNAIQSWQTQRGQLGDPDSALRRLRVEICIDTTNRTITVRDNAGGIARSEFARAFRPADVPPDRTGLSEFGMGMKSASCWAANRWTVRTKPIGDPSEYRVSFDVPRIVKEGNDEIDVERSDADPAAHYTEIRLEEIGELPAQKTIAKIKEHLTSIYREFLRKGDLDLKFNNESLEYQDPAVLEAPHYQDPHGQPRRWRVPIEFDFGLGLRARGFAALLQKGSTARAGFALFRRGRVIQGSADEGYRPSELFGPPNSYRYQRLFGELHLEGFEVTHTKDGFKWGPNEEVLLALLHEKLSDKALPLLRQAEEYRANAAREEDLRKPAEAAVAHVVHALETRAAPVIEVARTTAEVAPVPVALTPSPVLARREFKIHHAPWTWIVTIEQTQDNPAADWIEVSDSASRPSAENERRLGLRLSLAHPFMQRFRGAHAESLEPLLRVAVALGLAEAVAREMNNSPVVGRIRRDLNNFLRHALSSPDSE